MGFLAWDKRTGEVIYSLPTPHGYVGGFNWEYVFQDNPDYPEHIGTSDNGPDFTTEDANKLFRVVGDKIVPKG